MTAPGTQDINADDEAYAGSRFSELWEAVKANPYQRVWGSPDARPFPVHAVTLRSVLRGILPFGETYQFLAAARRTIFTRADLRWGPDGKGVRRLLHPNGICLKGRWRIDEETPYSGYFRKGSEGLMIVRYSTCCTETRRGRNRSLSMVGKIFPTVDESDARRLRPAHFITQQDLGGERSDYINDAELRNAPDTTAWRRGLRPAGVPVLLTTGIVLGRADPQPSRRQVYPIAELGKPAGVATAAPRFMRLTVTPRQPRIEGEDLDFRDEVMAQIFDKGDPKPRRTLSFDVAVTDAGRLRGVSAYSRWSFDGWKRIGTMTFDDAVASHNGDFVIHFHHPKWRQDLEP